MRFPEDATNWPLTEHSRIILCRPHRWHVQVAGQGPLLLLIHGAGGATQSFRGLFPILARHHRVVAIDLPGQGFTRIGGRQRLGLDTMAEDIGKLLAQEGWRPQAIIGHSAGAAIALRMAMEDPPPGGVIGINAALGKFRGVAGWLFPLMAKVLAFNPFSANMFTATATPASVGKLLKGTGSTLDPEGEALYLRLAQDRGHVDATLSMMAQWDLDDLLAALPTIDVPVLLITGGRDTAVPPETSVQAARDLPQATVLDLDGLGHLAHEEAPERIAAEIMSWLDRQTPRQTAL
ncbi:alpha/beta fold hydrolase [Ponticoccus sp. SC2-23]|uniref:alpha/beta fold hydrolase BchO n=1 Tax=Alexandriicola marinus TaxID=2081710 RepID=UPI000FD7252A|nr:alpha/beta fold hydrolase BchO [Alexandriicola marinus]MBM1221726.1 alpha/beta fold hydrolase [Ponticoccus sp. SC6-9]MBM1226077.1 alpha/beta fold hydrolase [Ponticoccus sp. SC6-15]MBM1230674.1 alpha/beta fold hydrolase [Ponticoccus sp. SC6-38]MBM1235486.1 alpha/beta fold hydrolase [Ponticoccus sp. SC6-45]MBM1239695.1 alpha/beta fold hydrolase [Ponticoccus sp. SC6-49]MBM1243839.1 alpha/beta fold hydrolase [Ponticoccus sp. SC2-64]MBM1249009.1 alpha/beta fold hydrolase [Ponticoccus sp. SC6-4